MTTETTTAPGGETTLRVTQEGIVGFYAESTACEDFQAEKFGLEYRFATPMSYVDAIASFGDIQGQAREQAEAKLADVLNQRAAQAKAAQPAPAVAPAPAPVQSPAPAPAPVQAQPPTPPHPATSGVEPSIDEIVEQELDGQHLETAQPGGLPIQVGTSPKGQQVRFVHPQHLPSLAFEDEIRRQITELGYVSDEFVVFDNRVTREGAKYPGLDQGGKVYSVATVRARKDTPMQAAIGEKATAFFVDFNEDGTVKVKATDKVAGAAAARAAFAG